MSLGFMANCKEVEGSSKLSALDLGPPKVNEKDKKSGVHCAGLA